MVLAVFGFCGLRFLTVARHTPRTTLGFLGTFNANFVYLSFQNIVDLASIKWFFAPDVFALMGLTKLGRRILGTVILCTFLMRAGIQSVGVNVFRYVVQNNTGWTEPDRLGDLFQRWSEAINMKFASTIVLTQ
jgi:hypothetical protein